MCSDGCISDFPCIKEVDGELYALNPKASSVYLVCCRSSRTEVLSNIEKSQSIRRIPFGREISSVIYLLLAALFWYYACFIRTRTPTQRSRKLVEFLEALDQHSLYDEKKFGKNAGGLYGICVILRAKK